MFLFGAIVLGVFHEAIELVAQEDDLISKIANDIFLEVAALLGGKEAIIARDREGGGGVSGLWVGIRLRFQ
ncbi:MAG: hypothetical protein Q7U34_09560 [Anaerolineales bacterium]|nr:hypothetical protein [Anaerolineales bacterium]